MPGKTTESVPSTGNPTILTGDPDGIAASQLQSDPALEITAIWGMKRRSPLVSMCHLNKDTDLEGREGERKKRKKGRDKRKGGRTNLWMEMEGRKKEKIYTFVISKSCDNTAFLQSAND